MEIDIRRARRLALVAAGLLRPDWSGLSPRGSGGGRAARETALRIVRHFGYLQLDTVSVAGMRSHPLVLWSRHPRIDPALGEELLRPGAPLFEYWGHEASWLPQELYPLFEFRRNHFRRSDWWNDIQRAHPGTAGEILKRIRDHGPIRSADLDGRGEGGWWGHKPAKRIVVALWSSGDLAVRERKNFQRTFDLPERVIPAEFRQRPASRAESLRELLALALRGHGWAPIGTLATTWRLRNCRPELNQALEELREEGRARHCALRTASGRPQPGWILSDHAELVERTARLRPDPEAARVLSPFDPVLWDRKRVELLFGFEQTLEIFKPAESRVFGYFCLPVLAGERFVGRVDLKADRRSGAVHVLSEHVEETGGRRQIRSAVTDFANALDLEPRFPRSRRGRGSGPSADSGPDRGRRQGLGPDRGRRRGSG